MAQSISARRAAFRKLHEQGCFIMPNPWDVGSARMFQHMGFQALASTSTGYAWTTGRPDYAMTLDDVLHHLKAMCDGVDVPVNADFEAGFARGPDELAITVGRPSKPALPAYRSRIAIPMGASSKPISRPNASGPHAWQSTVRVMM